MSFMSTTAANGKTSADTSFEIDINPQAFTHQIGCRHTGGTTGTLTYEVMPVGAESYESLTVSGVALSSSLMTDEFKPPFDGFIKKIRVTQSGFDGDEFSVIVNSGA